MGSLSPIRLAAYVAPALLLVASVPAWGIWRARQRLRTRQRSTSWVALSVACVLVSLVVAAGSSAVALYVFTTSGSRPEHLGTLLEAVAAACAPLVVALVCLVLSVVANQRAASPAAVSTGAEAGLAPPR